tara:strand:+ start:3822 stop:4709 length:888 start_codon:yes stop_codon:yes gene_type:complete
MADKFHKKQDEQVEEGLPIWMATFADMMTLLFAFFVLLFSMSTIDPVKVSAMEDAMNENAVKAGAGGVVGEGNSGAPQARLSISEIKGTLEDIIDSLDIDEEATVSSDPRGVILELNGSICFPSLSSDLREDFKRVLVQIKDKVISHPYDKRTVIIEGHSDNEPIKPDQPYHKNPNIKAIEVWGTNRHLSAARASQVVEVLTSDGFCLSDESCDVEDWKIKDDCNKCNSQGSKWYPMGIRPNRLVAAGYGEYWPYGVSWNEVKADDFTYDDIERLNQTAEQRNKNRRVKIIFAKN